MKSEAEIRRAIWHLRGAAQGALEHGADIDAAQSLAMVDLLRWVIGEANRFGREVMAPCDAEDARSGCRVN